MFYYLKAKNAVKNFLKEEKGASDIVAIIVIIVVVIGIAGIFKNQLEAVVSNVFGKLMQFIGE